MHNEDFHDLYSSANMLGDKIMTFELGRVCGMHEGEQICVEAFGGETRMNEII
jgi:hypothetical protein